MAEIEQRLHDTREIGDRTQIGRREDEPVVVGAERRRLLAADPDPVVHNAVGIFAKHAGTRDPDALHQFLAAHAASMPRPALRLAIEKLDADDRARYLG